MKRSTGFRDYVLASGSVKQALDGKVITFYGGTVPASADAALGSAVPLCTITVDGAGGTLNMATAPAGGQLPKSSSQVWRGDITTAGTATFFRHHALGDDGSLSTAAVRLQGTVGLVGTDIEVSDVIFTPGDERKINYYVVAITEG